jgi:hypothetical protein
MFITQLSNGKYLVNEIHEFNSRQEAMEHTFMRFLEEWKEKNFILLESGNFTTV